MAERTFRRDEKRSLRDRIRPIVAIAVASFRADPGRASLSLALRLTAAGSGPVFAAAVASLVESARPGQPPHRALVAALVMSAAVASWSVLDEMGWKVVQILEERTSHVIDLDVIQLVSGLPGLEHLERPEHLDRVERIKEEQWLLGMSVEAVMQSLVITFNIGLTVVLLATVDLVLLLLPVLALPSILASAKAERLRWKVLDENVRDYRLSEDLFKLATDVAPAKELRVFGLGPELIERMRALVRHMEGWERDHRLKGAYWVSAGRAVFVVGYVASIGLVAAKLMRGQASARDLTFTVVLAGQVMQQLNGASGTANWTTWTFTAVRRWLWLLDYAKDAANLGAKRDVTAAIAAPATLSEGIRFEGVSFRYPGLDAEVLRDVDLMIPAGSTVALVGDNGAGKSTLVKLLCRFYAPTEGRILVDGVDLADLDVAAWRSSVGAVFQDHARLEFPAIEAVTLGDLDHFGDEAAASEALVRAGSADVLAALPEGWRTQLGARWPGGVDLSGGQWQKLALGRGLMRSGALLFVFDEPTAALDAETEHRLFESYARLAHEGRASTGTITVLVSHRFSTVRMADLIVVVSGGRIAELGSHAELMTKGRLYAELYSLQARAYR